jgi:hypothetical protein
VKSAADLDRVAKANNLTVQESEFFLRDEPIRLGPSPEAAAEAFTLKEGEPVRSASRRAGHPRAHRDAGGACPS